MTILAVMAVLILTASVWFLARPVTRLRRRRQRGRAARTCVTARATAHATERSRHRNRRSQHGSAVIGDERQRLERTGAGAASLDTIQLRLLRCGGGQCRCISLRRTRRMTLIALAVLLPVVGYRVYAGMQAKTVDQHSQLGPGGQPDPFKMVARPSATGKRA